MPFSFLNPWLWLGALALAAPLWLHLRRKQETNLLRFSAVRFLEDEPQPRQSPLRLRDLLLFLVRVAAILLVVAAFAWPYLRKRGLVPVEQSRVYIFDNTLSHKANNGFTRDRELLLREVGRAGPNVQVAVVELAASPRVLVGFSDTRETARDRIARLEPSFQRGSYLAAFRQANTLLAKSLGLKRRIIFFGDNQQNQWNENVNSPPFLKDVEVEMPPTADSSLANLSLAEPRVQRVFLGDKSLVNFTAKLTHLGPAATANIVLRANGQAIINRSIDLEPQPGTMLLQAQWEADTTSWVKGELVIDGSPDTLPDDNRLFFSLAPVIEGRVALLAQSQYLRLALSPDIMRGQWATHLIEPARVSDELKTNNDAEVLCIESNFLQSSDARKLLWRYLSNGRGVILLVNRVTPAISGFLRELGFEAEAPNPATPQTPDSIRFVLSNHPIFHPFLSPDYGNLLEIKLYQHVRLKSSQAIPLVFSDRGDELFFQSTKSQGKLFVAAFGLDRDQTSWPVHQTFIPFLDLALQTARAEDPTPTAFEPGQVTLFQLPASVTAREVLLRDDQKEWVRMPIEQGRVRLPLPGTPGLYSLTYDDSKVTEKVFSINPSPKESELTFIANPAPLQLWKLNQNHDASKVVSTPIPPLSLAGILQQRVWWWMVVAGLSALLLETLLTLKPQPKSAS